MSTPSKRPPGLREFDYFADAAKPANLDTLNGLELPAGVEGQLHRFRSIDLRFRVVLVAGAMWWLVVAAFVFGVYRAEFVYALMTSSVVTRLGDVAEMTPADIPHNRYVELSGITEPRAMKQERSRGLSLRAVEMWYFRLAGSEGVYLEVPAASNRVNYASEVTVRGRAVDPGDSGTYRRLLDGFQDEFRGERRRVARVIQVDVAPGDDRGRAWGVLFVLFALGVSEIVVFRRWRAGRQRRAS